MSDELAADAKQSFYAVEAPGTLRSNTKYNVVVSIFQSSEPCSVAVNIISGNYKEEQLVELPAKTTEMIEFDVPQLELDDYLLEVTGTGGLDFKERIKLNYEDNKPLTYIQLDKQGYKRGDKVDFRVIFLDNNLRPAYNVQTAKIVIQQNDENTVAEFENIKLKNGVFTSQWTIPDDVLFGIYIVDVRLAERAIAYKSFEIIEYEEPKFTIILNTQRKVRYENGFLNVAVEANYSDGEPVKGRCIVGCRCIAGYYGLNARPIEKYTDIDGTVNNIIFDIEQDLCIEKDFLTEPYFNTASLALDVMVEDTENDVKETFTEILTIIKQRFPNDSKDDQECVSCGGWSPFKLSCDIENSKPIAINISNQELKLGEPIHFDIMLNKPALYFVYIITARGNIIKSEIVSLEENQTNHTLSLDTNFEMVPRAFMLAYFVYEGELFFDEIGFNLKHEFENKLKVIAPATAEAGTEIEIHVESDANSLISIMAIDAKSVLLDSRNDVYSKDLFKALHKVRSQTPWLDGSGEYPGLMSGLVTLTNATWKGFVKGDADGWNQRMSDREHLNISKDNRYFNVNREKKEVQRKIQERNQTFGNWMYFDKETDDDGHLHLIEQLPETPTTWLLTAISINPSTGFALTETPLKVKASTTDESKDTECLDSISIDSIPKPFCKIEHFDVDLYEQEEYRNTYEIELLENTELLTVELTICSNLFGPTLAELADYAGTMYCTGMLHMTTFIPNIVILEYLERQNLLDSELAKSIIEKFEEAMKRELAERHENGSFGWFGCDEISSPHVTATIIGAFQRVSKFIAVDDAVINEGLDYLAAQQTENGNFIKEAQPYQNPFQAELGVGLTATILLAFLRNKENIETYQSTIGLAFDYIVSKLAATKCYYDLALAFYAMQLVEHPAAEELKERLLTSASNDANSQHKWWTYSEHNTDPHYNPPVSNLEVTSYVLLGLLETESLETLVPIIKWLLPYGQKLGQNNFSSECMDCAVSLDAVLKFAHKSDACSGVTRVEYTAYDEDEVEYKHSVVVEPRNALIIKTHLLPKKTHKIELRTTDKGSFKGHIAYRFISI